MTVIRLQDGKYEIERDENGLMVGMWRNGDFWKSGLELFAHAQAFHAALDEIERLRTAVKDECSLAALRVMLRAEVDRLISGSDVQAVYEKCAKIAEAHNEHRGDPADAIADCIREHARHHGQ